jgi:DNA polymerase-1
MQPTYYLIDGSGFIFRAYHAVPAMYNPNGVPVNSVYGFCSMLRKVLNQCSDNCHVSIILDSKGKNFRHDIYDQYKAHRPPLPEDLIPQFALIQEAIDSFNIPNCKVDGFEADDIIATYAKQIEQAGGHAIIVSSDKDLFQLISPQIKIWDAMKNKQYNDESCLEKFGVNPDKVIDVQALAGDSSDNVPGVPGVGIKTAAMLINDYDSLENLLANAHNIKQTKRRENLIEFKEQALLSKQLVTLRTDVPDISYSNDISPFRGLGAGSYDFLNNQGFNSLIRQLNLEASSHDIANDKNYQIIKDDAKLQQLMEQIIKNKVVAFDLAYDHINQKLLGISLATDANWAYFLEITTPVLEQLKQVFLARDILKICHDYKNIIRLLHESDPNIIINSYRDIFLASYVVYNNQHNHSLAVLSRLCLGEDKKSLEDFCGNKNCDFGEKTLAEIAEFFAENADFSLAIFHSLREKTIANKQNFIFQTIENPLANILQQMEQQGISIDAKELARLEQDWQQQITKIEAEIYHHAGGEFNIGSPKQLSDMLFKSMGIKPIGKAGKTGAFSTNSDVLETLASQGYDIAELTLKWRSLSKLVSTYTKALVKAIDQDTSRVHTTFTQTITATGRLSSRSPNIQNIPIRTEEGKYIRKAFVCQTGYKLISLDYSQIELRILADIANVTGLQDAFSHGIDCHAQTAKNLFNIDIDDISGEQRRFAKTINFGVIYGISAFGLAKQLRCSKAEAQNYIDDYFNIYPSIKDYMADTIAFARENHYVKTLYGRRCYVNDITASNFTVKQFAERAAINAPIQGTAADIIKLAMLDVDAYAQQNHHVKLLLQIHDELIFECEADMAEQTLQDLQLIMEKVGSDKLRTKLKVDGAVGNNWHEAH